MTKIDPETGRPTINNGPLPRIPRRCARGARLTGWKAIRWAKQPRASRDLTSALPRTALGRRWPSRRLPRRVSFAAAGESDRSAAIPSVLPLTGRPTTRAQRVVLLCHREVSVRPDLAHVRLDVVRTVISGGRPTTGGTWRTLRPVFTLARRLDRARRVSTTSSSAKHTTASPALTWGKVLAYWREKNPGCA